MLRIERRKHKAFVMLNIFNDHRFAGDECSTLSRALIRPRYDASNHTRMPAIPRFDEEVVLLRAIATNLGIRNAQAPGADARGFSQDLVQIVFPESEAAKLRKRSLLP